MIPAFVQAMQDPATRGHARELYVWLHQRLDVVDFRSVKHSVIDQDLRIGGVAIKRAMDRLVSLGYVARGRRDGRLFSYRLTYSKAGQSAVQQKM